MNQTASCQDLSSIPANATHKDDLPDAVYDLVAFAPWLSKECSTLFLKAAQVDSTVVKAFIFFLNDRKMKIPDASDAFWNGVPFHHFEFPIYAISGDYGVPLLEKVSEYSGNMSEVWEVKNLTSYYDPMDYARVYMEVDTGMRSFPCDSECSLSYFRTTEPATRALVIPVDSFGSIVGHSWIDIIEHAFASVSIPTEASSPGCKWPS